MKELKNIKMGITHAKLTIDMGNSYIETIGKVQDGQEVKAYARSIYTTDVSITSKDKVECNGVTLAIGMGNRTLQAGDKTERKYIEHQILWATYNTLGSGQFSLDIATCLPINLYKAQKNNFKNKIKDMSAIVGTVNGEQITIYINEVVVMAESYSAIMPLLREQKISKDNDTLIIDVGFGTTDVIQVTYNEEEDTLDIVDFHTFDIALKDIYEVLQGQLLKRGADVSISAIDRKIKSSNPSFRTEQGDYNLMENITDAFDVSVELLTLIKNRFGKIVLYDKCFIGGGSKYLLESIEHQVSNIIELDEEIIYYGNALGMMERLDEE